MTVEPESPDEEAEEHHPPKRMKKLLRVADGERVVPGQPLTQGPIDPKKVLEYTNQRATAQHIVDEVQKVYLPQSVNIHDKHIEVIVRQMLRRVIIIKSGTRRS